MSRRLTSELDQSTTRQQSTGASEQTGEDQPPSPRHSSILPEPPRHLRWSIPMSAHNRQSSSTAERARSTLSEEDFSRQQRLQRVLIELSRVQAAASAASSIVAAYSNRTPSPNRQNLYDWAPSQPGQDREAARLERLMLDSARDEEQVQTESPRTVQQRYLPFEEARRSALLTSTEIGQEHLRDMGLSGAEQSSRTRRIPRQQPNQINPPSETNQQRRARAALGILSNLQQRRDYQAISQADIRAPAILGAQMQRLRAQMASSTSPVVPNPSSTSPVAPSRSSSSLLEKTLLYLDDLRVCDEDEQAIAAAASRGIVRRELVTDKHGDFITSLNTVGSFAESSWLQPGTIFKGHQQATTGSDPSHPDVASVAAGSGGRSQSRSPSTASFRNLTQPSHTVDEAPSGASNSRSNLQGTQPRSGTSAAKDPHDQWPVRVIIHAVDYDKMLIQGTMEAYDVPQNNGPATLVPTLCTSPDQESQLKTGQRSAPIKTYLEGHIIDLRTHSFLTPDPSALTDPIPHGPRHNPSSNHLIYSNANPSTDAAYWRQLPPFSTLLRHPSSSSSASASSSDPLAHILLSTSRLQSLHERYIFMRWKERCFIHSSSEPCADPANCSNDQDRGHGLTISGFYYVSLRRSDGAVEGLYLDRDSRPFQRLRLGAENARSGWPAFELR